jgi:hypothetical protein
MAKNAIAQRGYARNERDELLLLSLGLNSERIYLEGRGAETLDRIIMRQGELLATVGGLRALGNSRRDIVAATRRVHDMGAAVLDIETMARSDQRGAEMLDRAIADLNGELSMRPGQAREMQRKSVRSRIGDRMSQREAMKHWRDPRLSNGEAIRRMPGWSVRTAYMKLGKRGLPCGPIRNRN